jgi:hypothetical protein
LQSELEMGCITHRYESNQFYELNADGIRVLAPTITPFLNPRHKPRVCVASDRDTLKPTTRVVISRIADIEVFNPPSDFDYRISISVESPRMVTICISSH